MSRNNTKNIAVETEKSSTHGENESDHQSAAFFCHNEMT
jgi:hypothetical protein